MFLLNMTIYFICEYGLFGKNLIGYFTPSLLQMICSSGFALLV